MKYFTNQEKSEFFADGNCGLHYLNSSETFGSMGAYFQKSKQYKIKPTKESEVNCMSMYETSCNIKKPYVQHWLLQEIPQSFKVPKKNKWDPHPINIQKDCIYKVGGNYIVLADSGRGPQIIEHKQTIAIQFHFDSKYPESLTLLKNFISTKASEIKYRKSSYVNLDDAYQKAKETIIPMDDASDYKENKEHKKIRSSTSMKDCLTDNKDQVRPQTMRFLHCGFNYSKRRGELVVKNNAFGSFVKVETKVSKTANTSKSYIVTGSDSKSTIRPVTSGYNSRLYNSITLKAQQKSRANNLSEPSSSMYESMIKKTIANSSQIDKQECKILMQCNIEQTY